MLQTSLPLAGGMQRPDSSRPSVQLNNKQDKQHHLGLDTNEKQKLIHLEADHQLNSSPENDSRNQFENTDNYHISYDDPNDDDFMDDICIGNDFPQRPAYHVYNLLQFEFHLPVLSRIEIKPFNQIKVKTKLTIVEKIKDYVLYVQPNLEKNFPNLNIYGKNYFIYSSFMGRIEIEINNTSDKSVILNKDTIIGSLFLMPFGK